MIREQIIHATFWAAVCKAAPKRAKAHPTKMVRIRPILSPIQPPAMHYHQWVIWIQKMLDRLVKQCVHTQQSSNKSSSIVYSHNTTKQGFIVLETHQLLIVWRNVDTTHDTLIILIIIIVSGSSFRIRVNCAHGKICQNDTYSKEENGKTCSTVDCSN